MEQETKAKEEEARVLEEELRAKAEVDEMRKREKIELEELATRLRVSLEVIQTHPFFFGAFSSSTFEVEEAERRALAEVEEVRLREGDEC